MKQTKTKIIISLGLILCILLLIPFVILLEKPSILGALVAKVFVKPLAVNSTCTLELIEGWNLMSVACMPSNQSVESVFSPISGNYNSIHTYIASETLDNWKTYNPNLPSWVVFDLSQINEKQGYWIELDSNNTITIVGDIKIPSRIPLVQGWNLVGYPSNASKPLPSALSTITGSYSIVWTYNASLGAYLFYNPSLGSGTLTNVSPGLGYWINMTTGDILWVT